MIEFRGLDSFLYAFLLFLFMISGSFDFAIIGAGGSGLAAAMYGARLGLRTCVFGSTQAHGLPIGGTITNADVVENYPGFVSETGVSISKHLEEHARSYDLVTIKQERVLDVKKKAKSFWIKTNKAEYRAKAILFSTGSRWRRLEMPGVKEFENKGVHYCALCDAPLYKGKVAAVVGGSDTAAKDALILARHAKKVYIIYRKEKIRPEYDYLKKVQENKKVKIINKANVMEIKGDKVVKGLVLDRPHKDSKELKVDGVFMAIGHIPLSELARHLGLNLNKKGEIIINSMTAETSMPGVFAAGDVTNRPHKQLIVGVADGCTAAYSAYEYLKKKGLLKD
jgi:thioredoxin reductase (NADPH)